MSDVDFLEKLQDNIWTNFKSGILRELPTLSYATLNVVFQIVEDNRLGILMHNACMGFGIGITICHNQNIKSNSNAILTITNNHLGKNKGFEDGWKVFYPFVKRNQDLLLEKLEDKNYYDY